MGNYEKSEQVACNVDGTVTTNIHGNINLSVFELVSVGNDQNKVPNESPLNSFHFRRLKLSHYREIDESSNYILITLYVTI